MSGIERQQLGHLLQRLAESREDEEAWALLYKRLWPFVIGSIYRLLRGHRELAEDASQEVFYRIIRYYDFNKVKEPDAFLSYLYVICRNVARTVVSRIIEQNQGLSSAEKEKLSAMEVDRLTPEEVAHERQMLAQVLGDLDEKSSKLAEFLLNGYALSEVAQLLGISYSNAAVRVYRLRLQIRKHLIDKGIIRKSPKL